MQKRCSRSRSIIITSVWTTRPSTMTSSSPSRTHPPDRPDQLRQDAIGANAVISHTDLNRSADIPIFRLWPRLCKILKSHGAVLIEQYRQAASYVDRITVGAHQRARPKPYTNYRADAAYNDHQS